MLCPDENPGLRGGKQATNRLSYGTAKVHHIAEDINDTRRTPEASHPWFVALFSFRSREEIHIQIDNLKRKFT
jgi:hypothetical protein